MDKSYAQYVDKCRAQEDGIGIQIASKMTLFILQTTFFLQGNDTWYTIIIFNGTKSIPVKGILISKKNKKKNKLNQKELTVDASINL